MNKSTTSNFRIFFDRRGPKRLLALCLSVVVFYSNVVAVHAAESNFWADRKAVARKTKQDSSLSETLPSLGLSADQQARSGLSSEQNQLLAQLPKASQLDLGVAGDVAIHSALGTTPAPNVSLKQVSSSTAASPSRSKESAAWISSLILPYGSIRDIHLSKSANAPVVIHIQDAHGIEEAQKNIGNMIQGLREMRGINLVGLEGANGGFTIEPYRDFPDANITKDIAEYLLKEGYIGGPEFVGFTAPEPPLLWGVENLSLYESDIKAFKDSLQQKPVLQPLLAEFKSSADRLKEKIYSAELKEFDRRFNGYKSKGDGLGAYVRYLMETYRGNNGRFTNLHLLVDALDWEESLEFKQVERDRLKLVDALAKKLPQDQLSLLVKQSLQYRLGHMSYGEYHRFLRALCQKNQIYLENYGQLNSYINYVLLAEQINRNELLVELSRMEEETQNSLAMQPEQKRLVAINRYILLLDKLADHSMTMPDWLYYESHRDDVLNVPREMLHLSSAQGISVSLSPANDLSKIIQPFEQFCLYATQRNNALVENLVSKMKSENTTSAVLVAGGFHTDGLTQVLRNKDVSFVVVTPKIAEVPKVGHYLDIFARDPLPLEKLFASEKIFMTYPLRSASKAVSGFEDDSKTLGEMVLAGQAVLQIHDAAQANQLTVEAEQRHIEHVRKNAGRAGIEIGVEEVSTQPGYTTVELEVDDGEPLVAVATEVDRTEAAERAMRKKGFNPVSTLIGKRALILSRLPWHKLSPSKIMSHIWRKIKGNRLVDLPATDSVQPTVNLGPKSTSIKPASILDRFIKWVLNKSGLNEDSRAYKTIYGIYTAGIAPYWETAALPVFLSVAKSLLSAMSFMDPTGTTFAVLLLTGVLFSLAHFDLYDKSTYVDGKFSWKEFFLRFGVRMAGGSAFTALLLLPGGFYLSWGLHAFLNLGIAMGWSGFKFLKPFSVLTLGARLGSRTDNDLKPSKYIYDPLMRRPLISRMKTKYGFIGKEDAEYRVLYDEVNEVFQNVLKSASDLLIASGKIEQAEGLREADLFLADMNGPNAFAVIYFNFVAVNIGLFRELQENGLLTKDVIAFILSHEITHLIQYREDVDAGRVQAGLEFTTLGDLLKKKTHEAINRYGKEQDADVRAVEIVNAAGYSVSEITTFFVMIQRDQNMRSRFSEMIDEHPVPEERIDYLQRVRRRGNWRETHNTQQFSEAAIQEITGPRSRFRQLQERIVAVTTFDKLQEAIADAQSPEEVEFLMTGTLTQVLRNSAGEIIKDSFGQVVTTEIIEDFRAIIKRLVDRKSSIIIQNGVKLENSKLWMDRTIQIEEETNIEEVMAYFLFSYLATGELPSLEDRTAEAGDLAALANVMARIKGNFASHQKIRDVLGERERTLEMLRDRHVLFLGTHPLAVIMREVLATNPTRRFGGVDYEEKHMMDMRMIDLMASEGLDDLLSMLKQLSLLQEWGFDLDKLPDEFGGYASSLFKVRDELFQLFVDELVRRIISASNGKSTNELIEILNLLGQKDRELLGGKIKGLDSLIKAMTQKIEHGGRSERQSLLTYLLHNEFLHGIDEVTHFIYDELVLNPDSEEIINALASSKILRSGVYNRLESTINRSRLGLGGGRILFFEELQKGDLEKVIRIFKLTPLEISQLYLKVEGAAGPRNAKQKLIVLKKYKSEADRVNIEQGGRKGLTDDELDSELQDILSIGQATLFGSGHGLIEDDVEYIKSEVSQALGNAGIDVDVSEINFEIVKWILFFEYGGLLRHEEFRELARAFVQDSGIPEKELGILAAFLNSDYTHQRQRDRGMPTTFSPERVDKGEAGREMLIGLGDPTAEELILNRTFYRAQTWAEYIFYLNLLVYLRATDQNSELQRVLHIDSEQGNYRMFAGEISESSVDRPAQSNIGNSGISDLFKQNPLYKEMKDKLKRMFERIFKKLIFGSPKYLDRRDLLEDSEKEIDLFWYILASNKSFDALLSEISTFLPPSVYRNYALLHLLAKLINEVDPSFKIKNRIDVDQIKKIIRKRQKAGVDNTHIFDAINKISPLLLYDGRMDSINTSLLSYWGLKQAGKKRSGIGGRDMRDFKGLFKFDQTTLQIGQIAVQVNMPMYRRIINALKSALRLFLERIKQQYVMPLLKVAVFSLAYMALKVWYFALKATKIRSKKYVSVVQSFLGPRYDSGAAAEDIDYVHVQVENFYRESLLRQLYENVKVMILIRWAYVRYNWYTKGKPSNDIFHFDYQGKQTQLDTSIADLAESEISSVLSDQATSFQDKKKYIETVFGRQSALRDKYLEILAEYEIATRQDDLEQLLENLNSIRDLFANRYFTDKYGLVCFGIEREIHPNQYNWDDQQYAGMTAEQVGTAHYGFIRQNVRLAQKYFRSGYTRDDILLSILEAARTYDEYMLIKPLLYQYKGDVLSNEDTTRSVYYQDKLSLILQDASAKDKKELLLWILGVKGKPLFLSEWEVFFGVNFDRLRSVFGQKQGALLSSTAGGVSFERIGQSVKKEFIRQMFVGQDGILSDDALFEEFMSEAFDSVVPNGKLPKKSLKTIMKVILSKSDANRKLEFVQTLSINMAKAFEGEKQNEAEVIARSFESMGLVGIKMAQVLAHSHDIALPAEIREALNNLSSRADPLSKMVVFETVQNVYPGGFSDHFEYIGERLGSASIKIVYTAKRKGADREHVLKVKRPDVDQQIKADLEFLRSVLQELENAGFPIPEGMAERVAGAISDDADFDQEYRITQEFERQVEEINRDNYYALSDGRTRVDFEVARIHEGSVRRNVTMETDFAEGISLDKEHLLIESGVLSRQELKEVKRIIFDFLMKQMFHYGFYLADPHGGNFHIARDGDKIKVILIDSGSAERVERNLANQQALLEAMIWLSINPGKAIPQEYLYTSVFFTKVGYLRSTLSDLEMLQVIFQYLKIPKQMPDGTEGTMTPREYRQQLREKFSQEMTFSEKAGYVLRSITRRIRNGPKSKVDSSDQGSTTGALGFWTRLGISNLPLIGIFETLIVAAISLLFLAAGMPQGPPVFDFNFILTLLQSSLTVLLIGYPLLVLAHRVFGALRYDPVLKNYQSKVSRPLLFLSAPFLVAGVTLLFISGPLAAAGVMAFGVLLGALVPGRQNKSVFWLTLKAGWTASSSLLSVPFLIAGLALWSVSWPLAMTVMAIGVLLAAVIHARRNTVAERSQIGNLSFRRMPVRVAARGLPNQHLNKREFMQMLLQRYLLGQAAAPVGFDVALKGKSHQEDLAVLRKLALSLGVSEPVSGEEEFIREVLSFLNQGEATQGADWDQLAKSLEAVSADELYGVDLSDGERSVQKVVGMVERQVSQFARLDALTQKAQRDKFIREVQPLLAMLHHLDRSFLKERGLIGLSNVADGQALDMAFVLNLAFREDAQALNQEQTKPYAQIRQRAHQWGINTRERSFAQAFKENRPVVVNISEIFEDGKLIPAEDRAIILARLKETLKDLKATREQNPDSQSPIGLTVQDAKVTDAAINGLADTELRNLIAELRERHGARLLLAGQQTILDSATGKLSARLVATVMGSKIMPYIYTLQEEDWVDLRDALVKIIMSAGLVRNAASQKLEEIKQDQFIRIQA